MTLKEILKTWLENRGFQGFYSGHECHCHIDNLMLGSMCDCSDCMPGYQTGTAEDWIIGPDTRDFGGDNGDSV